MREGVVRNRGRRSFVFGSSRFESSAGVFRQPGGNGRNPLGRLDPDGADGVPQESGPQARAFRVRQGSESGGRGHANERRRVLKDLAEP